MKKTLILASFLLSLGVSFGASGLGGGSLSNPGGGNVTINYLNITNSLAINVRNFGATGDGLTDDSRAIKSAWTNVSTTGGTLYFPAGSYVVTEQIIAPNDGGTSPKQLTVKLLGDGCGKSGKFQNSAPHPATRILLRNNTLPAKIVTIGDGYLIATGIQFEDDTDGTTPFIYSTGTSLNINDCSFVGHTNAYPIQDAIIIGGTNTTFGGNTLGEGFQGYGTTISDCYFSYIQRGIWLRTFANGVQICNNTWWNNCGGCAALQISGNDDSNNWTGGNYISGNLIEIVNYTNCFVLTNADANCFVGNQIWDPNSAVNACYFRLDNSKNNSFFGGLIPTSVNMCLGNSVAQNTFIGGSRNFWDDGGTDITQQGRSSSLLNGGLSISSGSWNDALNYRGGLNLFNLPLTNRVLSFGYSTNLDMGRIASLNYNVGAKPLYIQTSALGIGSGNPTAAPTDGLELHGSARIDNGNLRIYSNGGGNGTAYILSMARSDGNYASPTDVAEGDILGTLGWYSYISYLGGYKSTAFIQAVADSQAGYNTSVGHLEFHTTRLGDAGSSLSMQLKANGDLSLVGSLSATNGVTFVPAVVYSGPVCTNGLGHQWNSNGVIILRYSSLGATTWNEKQIAP